MTDAQQPELVPVPQDDGPQPVAAIAYSDTATAALGLFRAVLAADELSERALFITGAVIHENAANYTAWWYRRRCLKALNADWRQELSYVSHQAEENPKNYQIWYHRRLVVEELGDPTEELAFTRRILMDDGKNYHAWSHRQWVLTTFALWTKELEFVEELLVEDVRNNSAWNHRWFTLSHISDFTPAVRKEEVEYVFRHLASAANNPSPYAYLLAVLRGQSLSDFPAVGTHVAALAADNPDCVELLSFQARAFMRSTDAATVATAAPICDRLAELDPVRVTYWKHMSARAAAASTSTATSSPAATAADTSTSGSGSGAGGE